MGGPNDETSRAKAQRRKGANGSNGHGETGEPVGVHPKGGGERSDGAVIGKPFV